MPAHHGPTGPGSQKKPKLPPQPRQARSVPYASEQKLRSTFKKLPQDWFLLSWNLNGIRARMKDLTLSQMLRAYSPDVLAFQEIKISFKKLSRLKALRAMLKSQGYEHMYFHCCTHCESKAGYSGVAIVSKVQPSRCTRAIWLKMNKILKAGS